MLALPVVVSLRELRDAVSGGRLVPQHERSPREDVHNAVFRATDEILRLLREFAGRIARGERCHIVEVLHATAADRLRLELVIETEEP